MNISIVIVNYKSKGHALNCVKSIKEADWGFLGGKLRYEIFVVDNNSGDNIGEILEWQYPDVIFIQNSENIGMGGGNNVGMKKARGEYIVVMNPDTIAIKDVFARLFEYMEANPEVGIVGPQLLAPDKSIQASCHRWYRPMTFFYRRTFLKRFKFAQKDLDRFLMKDFDHKREFKVDWLQGSFLFCRKSALDETGYFDERFFMYLEDTDLCRRMWEKKWRVVYYPKVQVIHNHTRASFQIAWYAFFLNKMARIHFVSWIRYMLKWGLKNRKVRT